MQRRTPLPALRSGRLALLAAALFGVSTPLVQWFGAGVGAFATAALLYAGAATVGALSRRPQRADAGLARPDLPRLVATAASLMLKLEAPRTALLARSSPQGDGPALQGCDAAADVWRAWHST